MEVQIVSNSKGHMTVRVTSKDIAVANANYNNDGFKEYYVGGIPEDLRTR